MKFSHKCTKNEDKKQTGKLKNMCRILRKNYIVRQHKDNNALISKSGRCFLNLTYILIKRAGFKGSWKFRFYTALPIFVPRLNLQFMSRKCTHKKTYWKNCLNAVLYLTYWRNTVQYFLMLFGFGDCIGHKSVSCKGIWATRFKREYSNVAS